MLSATEITSRSFQLYKQNWKPMILLGMVSLGLTQLANISTDGEIIGSLLSLVLAVLIAPLTQGGYYFYLMNVWGEKPSSVRDIFYFCKSAQSFGKALWFFFCYSVVTWVVVILTAVIPILFVALLGGAVLNEISFYLAMMIILIPCLWLVFRFILSPYLFICGTEDGAITIIARSFEMMKGYVWKFVLLTLVILLIELIYILPEYLLISAGTSPGIVGAFTFLLNLLVYPLSSLMSTGFLCEVLRERGVIADENAQLMEDGTEFLASADSDVQEAVITEEKGDIYYDEI